MPPRVAPILVLLAACGGPPPTRAAPATDAPTAGASPSAPADDGGPPSVAGPLGQADCARLLDHILALELTAMRARLPADQVPTEAQLAAIRESFAREQMAGCVGAERPPFDCAMAAGTSEIARACLAQPAP